MDIRKVPTEKELEKTMNSYEDIKYTWKDNPVLKVTKKVKGKVQIQMKDETKTVNLSELKKTEEYQKLFDANNALKNYIKKNDCRVVRDHCHFTGEFRGAAHNLCNRQFRKTYKIPVFLAAMSSSRSDDVTKSVCVSVCLSVSLSVCSPFLKFIKSRKYLGIATGGKCPGTTGRRL